MEEGFLRAHSGQSARHTPQEVAVRSEGLRQETGTLQKLLVLVQKLSLLRRNLQRNGLKEALDAGLPLPQLLCHLLEEDSLVSSMLVYEVHTVRPFGGQIGVLHLAQDPQDWESRTGKQGDG